MIKAFVFVLFALVFSPVQASDALVLFGNEDIFKETVVLTIDDCANEAHTREMFELLMEHDLRATFFPNLDYISKHDPSLWRDIVNAGFTIGYHTTDHESGKSYNELEADFQSFETALRLILDDSHFEVRFVRPPFGDWNNDWLKWASDNGLYTVRWNFVPSSKTTFEQLEATYRHELGGSIILLHPRNFDTEWLETNLDQLKNLVGGALSANSRTFPSLDSLFPPG